MDNWKIEIMAACKEKGILCSEVPPGDRLAIVSYHPMFVTVDERNHDIVITVSMLAVMNEAADSPETMAKLVPVARQVASSVMPSIGMGVRMRPDKKNIEIALRLSAADGTPTPLITLMIETFSQIQKTLDDLIHGRLTDDEQMGIIARAQISEPPTS